MTYPEFLTRWQSAGGAERANYGLFLQELSDLIGVPHPNPTTDTSPAVREWPKDLAGQMQAIRDVVQQAGAPNSGCTVAARFGRLRPATVQPLLDTLTALALLRQTDGGYVG